METENTPLAAEILTFSKALADTNRLKIIGLLANHDYNVEEISELLQLQPSTISHHLSKLAKAGLVSSRGDSYYNIYHLEAGAILHMAKLLSEKQTLREMASDVDLDAYDRKVLKNFTNADGTIVKEFPAQFKKFKVLLRYVVRDFEYDRTYTEKEVNDVLRRYHEDFARLRRELVEQGFLTRDPRGTAYERVKDEDRREPDESASSWAK